MEMFKSHQLRNVDFLRVISDSFGAFLTKGTSRSTDKLKPLHGAIAQDIAERLGRDYEVWSQGYLFDREADMQGRYINKKVDITIKHKGHPVAGIAVKFVMQNYSQNSNNYFENMLGETANIRCNHCPYFQVFIILDRLPYYKKDKTISKWETFSDHNISKYVKLSEDDVDVYFHTPNKTLIYVVHLPNPSVDIETQEKYMNYYRLNGHNLTLSSHKYDSFRSAVILNDYELFIEKVYHTIKSL